MRLMRSIAIKPAPISPSEAAISPDGRTIVIGSQNGSVSFIDAYTGHARPRTGEHSASVAAVVYAGDRGVMTVGDDDKVIVWDPQSVMPVKVLTAQAGQVQGAAVSPDATTLYTTSNDGAVFAWDLIGDRRLGRNSRFGAALGCCDPVSPIAPAAALSPDGLRFAARIGASTIGLFSTTTLHRESSFTISPRTDPVTVLAWSPSGSELAVAGHAGLVQLWRVDGSPRLMRSLVGLQPRFLERPTRSKDWHSLPTEGLSPRATTTRPPPSPAQSPAHAANPAITITTSMPGDPVFGGLTV